jgi:hypothetical protein
MPAPWRFGKPLFDPSDTSIGDWRSQPFDGDHAERMHAAVLVYRDVFAGHETFLVEVIAGLVRNVDVVLERP